MIATIGFHAALECIKFVFGLVSAPVPAGGADSAPPKSPGWYNGDPTCKGKERGGEGKDVDGRGVGPLTQIPGSALEVIDWLLPIC